MKKINQYLVEKFKISSNNIEKKKNRSLKDWTISKAEDGDFVKFGNIYFIFKCLNTGHKYGDLSENSIVYHAYYNTTTNNLFSNIGMGVGGGGDESRYHLLDDDEKEKFIQILYDKGYIWDEEEKKLIEK